MKSDIIKYAKSISSTYTERRHMAKTYQWDVISRFLTEEQQKDFIKKYKLSVRIGGTRGISLADPVTDEEIKLIRDYFNPDKQISEILREHKLRPASVYGKVGRIAQKILFQNREKVGI